MVRLLETSVALNNRAGALNMFGLWAVSGVIAGLMFVLCARQLERVPAARVIWEGMP